MSDPSRKRIWTELTTIEAGALPADTVALLPVAAVEQHGPHLPVGTDAYINRGIVARMLELLPPDVSCVVLPEQTIGASQEHLDFPGSLSRSAARLIESWTDVLTCARAAGIRHFLLFNSHGGQTGLLAATALDLRIRFGLFVAYASWFSAGAPDGLFTADEQRYGMHGGDIETSLMLAIRPDLVRMAAAIDFRSAAIAIERSGRQMSANPGGGRLGGFGWKAQDLNEHGVTGDASIATAEKGAAMLDHLAGRLAELIVDIPRAAQVVDEDRQRG